MILSGEDLPSLEVGIAHTPDHEGLLTPSLTVDHASSHWAGARRYAAHLEPAACSGHPAAHRESLILSDASS